MMQIEQFKKEMYPEIARWWKGHGQFAVDLEALPLTSAVATSEDGDLLGAAWVYLDNSIGVALLAWPVVNPDIAGKLKLKSLKTVIDYLLSYVKTLGYGLLIGFSSKESINRLYEKEGFVVFDKNSTFSAKEL